jgi:methionyl-tRNA formyltransferase
MQEKIILLGNGSYYSIAVLDNLLERGITPVAIALPEYPPSKRNESIKFEVEQAVPPNNLIETARRLSIPLIYAPRALSGSLPEKLVAFKADFILVACWPYLLAPAINDSISRAAFNLHPSLLPKYPGATPVIDQLAKKETSLGVTLHLLSQEYDRGEIVAQAGFILENGLGGRRQIEARAALTGAALFVEAIRAKSGTG